MSLQNNFSQTSPFGKITLLVVLMMVGVVIALLVLVGLNLAFFHVPTDVVNHISSSSSAMAINAAKVLQITSQIGLFVLPAFVFAYLTSSSATTGLKLNRRAKLQSAMLVIVITLLAIPFINLLAQWNMDWHLPESWHVVEEWMRRTQDTNDKMITVLAQMNTKTDIVVNVLMMAILPAIGEELIFRGILQPQMIKMTRNAHLGIILTAVIFSAFHLQFLGFFSRAILGIIFGYLFYYSKNIRYPMIAHFVNNMFALGLIMVFGTKLEETNFENPYDTTTIAIAIITFGLSIALFWFTNTQFKKETEQVETI